MTYLSSLIQKDWFQLHQLGKPNNYLWGRGTHLVGSNFVQVLFISTIPYLLPILKWSLLLVMQSVLVLSIVWLTFSSSSVCPGSVMNRLGLPLRWSSLDFVCDVCVILTFQKMGTESNRSTVACERGLGCFLFIVWSPILRWMSILVELYQCKLL